MRLHHRLWRVPLLHAFWLVLPLQIVMVWVALEGHARYRAARDLDRPKHGRAMPPFDLDQWRYFTRLELKRWLERLTATAPPEDDALETLHLTVSDASLAALDADLPESGKSTYHDALLRTAEGTARVEVRYMGDNHWHWLYPQKSWRIKMPKGEPLRDRRTFNVKNPTTVMVVEDTIVNEIAREIGLLAPEVRPVRLVQNGAYAGVYVWYDVVDESFLRRSRRMPGSLYSGDGAGPDETGVSRLWRVADLWQKDGSRSGEQTAFRGGIEALIGAVNQPDPIAFRAFAERHLDLERFASYVALDRLFGGMHHDYSHNHKYYFDPYRARFEPVVWDTSHWAAHRRPEAFDQALFPLLNAVRRHPDHELRIQRALHALAQRITPDELARRLDGWVARVRPSLAADALRDAKEFASQLALELPSVHCAHYGMRKFDDYVQWTKREFAARHRWLLDQLARSRLDYRVGAGLGHLTLDLVSSGLVGQRWHRLELAGADGPCAVYRDSDLDGALGPLDARVANGTITGGRLALALDEELLPGLLERPPTHELVVLYGDFSLAPAPLGYRYFVTHGERPAPSVALGAANLITGAPVAPRRTDALPDARAAFSCHPWRVPAAPPPGEVTLGPGKVVLRESVTYGAETEVTIRPGTTLALGPGVSLFARGRVTALGTEQAPVRFERLDPERPWGVVSLQGAGTAGSAFAHCSWQGGSAAASGLMQWSGMVSVLDTADITMEHCRVGANSLGDDALHWGYVTRGVVRDCEFAGAASDAFDVDVSEDVRIERCSFRGAGNDGLDLMTSRVEVVDCVFEGCGDKGLSVGEATEVELTSCRFSACTTGLEVKDGSRARLGAGVSFERCTTAIHLYRKNRRYGLGGTVEAASVRIDGCARPLVGDERSRAEVRRLIVDGRPETP